jgi:hypothetical protein
MWVFLEACVIETVTNKQTNSETEFVGPGRQPVGGRRNFKTQPSARLCCDWTGPDSRELSSFSIRIFACSYFKWH